MAAQKPGRTAAELADAVDLIRFSEDQFVCWDVLPDDDGVRTLCTPCVYEQYGYRVPVDNSTCVVANALLDLCEATATGWLSAKAKALADNLTVDQNALDGCIPTSLDVREGAKNRIRGFWGSTAPTPPFSRCSGWRNSPGRPPVFPQTSRTHADAGNGPGIPETGYFSVSCPINPTLFR